MRKVSFLLTGALSLDSNSDDETVEESDGPHGPIDVSLIVSGALTTETVENYTARYSIHVVMYRGNLGDCESMMLIIL